MNDICDDNRVQHSKDNGKLMAKTFRWMVQFSVDALKPPDDISDQATRNFNPSLNTSG